MEPITLDYERAAAYVGCSVRTLRAAKGRGLVQGVKIGRQIRFTQAALDAFVADLAGAQNKEIP